LATQKQNSKTDHQRGGGAAQYLGGPAGRGRGRGGNLELIDQRGRERQKGGNGIIIEILGEGENARGMETKDLSEKGREKRRRNADRNFSNSKIPKKRKRGRYSARTGGGVKKGGQL